MTSREEELDEVLARLAHALRTDDPADARAGLLEATRTAAHLLPTLPGAEAWRRVSAVAAALGIVPPEPGDPLDAAGLTPGVPFRLPGRLPGAWTPATALRRRVALQEQLRALVEDAPLEPEAQKVLGELAAAPVEGDSDALRCHLAILRALDQALEEARWAEEEAELVGRLEPLRRGAIAAAQQLGARVWPASGQERVQRGEAPCAVKELPDFGATPGRIAWVERHGFALPDGRSEEARLRVAREPAPPELPLLLEGYRALRRRRRELPDLVQSYRVWLRELPAAAGPEARATTMRYAATAVFALAEHDPAARATFQRFLAALEVAGSFLIPLDARGTFDPARYEVQLRPGEGSPRLVRPGFQTREGVVQQRARVVVDPERLGAG